MKILWLLVVALAVGCALVPTVPHTVSIPSQNGQLDLPGYWFPASVTEPRPAVISLHGCGGLLDARGRLNPSRFRVAEYFNAEKMHLLFVDSFSPR
jgi:dienelactone hydrolase